MRRFFLSSSLLVSLLPSIAIAQNADQARSFFCDIDGALESITLIWNDDKISVLNWRDNHTVSDTGQSFVIVQGNQVYQLEEKQLRYFGKDNRQKTANCFDATNDIIEVASILLPIAERQTKNEIDSLKEHLRQKTAFLLAARQEIEILSSDGVVAETRRQNELLNQQVAALRVQLADLRLLLDDAKSRDIAKDVQLQSLGSELNTALARLAAEMAKSK